MTGDRNQILNTNSAANCKSKSSQVCKSQFRLHDDTKVRLKHMEMLGKLQPIASQMVKLCSFR